MLYFTLKLLMSPDHSPGLTSTGRDVPFDIPQDTLWVTFYPPGWTLLVQTFHLICRNTHQRHKENAHYPQ